MSKKSNACLCITALILGGCGGGGDTAVTPPTGVGPIPTPIQVQRTSNENASLPNMQQVNLTNVSPQLPIGLQHWLGYAQADFKRNGTFQTIAASNATPWPTYTKGTIEFYEQSNDKQVRITSNFLDDNTGCIQPSQIIVADFNGDQRPDAFVPCFGYDAPPFPGEYSRILLSTPTGKYTNTEIQVRAIAHSASAADHTGAGFADIAVASMGWPATPSFILRNNRNGTFTPDYEGIRVNADQPHVAAITAVAFADVNMDGHYDLIASGNDVINRNGYTFRNRIHYGIGGGNLDPAPSYVPLLPNVGPKSTVVLQTIVRDNTIFFLRTSNDADMYYKGTYIDCFNTRTAYTSNIYNELKRPTNMFNGNWTDSIYFSGSMIKSSRETFKVSLEIPSTCM